MAPSSTDDDATSAAAPQNRMTLDEAIKLLPYLTRDHLLSIVESALSAASPPLLASLTAAADASRSHRRLRVQFVSPLTTLDELDAAFSPFGPVDHRDVRPHPTSDMLSIAVVEFSHAASAVRALENPSKRIAGRVTLASFARENRKPYAEAARELRVITVDRIPPGMTADRLIDHFQTFGEIEFGPSGFDREGRCRSGRASFAYKTEEGAYAAADETEQTVDESRLRCRRLGPK